ncbi:MAG: serine/threonine-protein kinase [Planctomycetota bacterium]
MAETVGPYRLSNARGPDGLPRAANPDGEPVALVRLDPRADAARLDRARALASLRHPSLRAILAVGEADGAAWIALEDLPGETLAQRLERGPLPIWEVTRLASQLASALGALHANGVLHLALDPTRVLLCAPHRASLTPLDPTGAGPAPGYAPPERDASPAADVYGLGALLYACLTAHAPTQPLAPPSRTNRQTPRWLDALILRCLAEDPRERPRDPSAVQRTLTLHERAHPHPLPVARRPRRLLLLGLLATLAAVALLWRAGAFAALGR